MNTSSGNLFLVGLMGAGKSTVGRALAQRLGKTFIDADHEIEARTGVKITVIFELEGEEGFRRREAEVIADLAQRTNVVLATGGGSVTNAKTREHLKARGVTLYLAANPHDLWMRTRHDHSRPLLNGNDAHAKLTQLLKQRDPLYREVADLTIETGKPSVSRLTGIIVEELIQHYPELLRPPAAHSNATETR